MPAAQTILVFLGVLSVLVLAHELGHFVVAKRAGIKVQEFGFGYPPRLLGIKVGETVYSLNLLPLGGFVRMLGETGNKGDMGSVDDQHIPGSFASKSKRVRAAVLAAGSAMNLLLVPVLFSIGLMIGEPVPCDGCNRVEIYGVQAGSPAAEAGLQGGDVFVSLNGQPIRRPGGRAHHRTHRGPGAAGDGRGAAGRRAPDPAPSPPASGERGPGPRTSPPSASSWARRWSPSATPSGRPSPWASSARGT